MSLSFCLWSDAVIFRSFSKLQNQLARWNVSHIHEISRVCLKKKKQTEIVWKVSAVWDCADLYIYILETKHTVHKCNAEEQAPQARTRLYIFNSRKVTILTTSPHSQKRRQMIYRRVKEVIDAKLEKLVLNRGD